jgi:tRNA-specific 2-thiouridylase
MMTMKDNSPVKAIGLISGGLDSALAAGLLKDLGVQVKGLYFSTGFCKVDHRRAINDPREAVERLRNPALRTGALLGFPVEMVDVAEAYLEVVRHPRYGYGANVNPCIDCRIFMLHKARAVMEQEGADLVFTGEVLGQRPMSQYKKALRLVEKNAGLRGRLLRPLSAHFMDPTIPELEGRLDRQRLLSIQGRSRRPQIELAKQLGLDEYTQPSGGCCYLADPNYARRFRDLVAHAGHRPITGEDTTLLKVGRHFRLNPALKMVAGRNEGENIFLERFARDCWTLSPAERGGSFALGLGEPDEGQVRLMASIVARYSQDREAETVAVEVARDSQRRLLHVAPASQESFQEFML